MPVRNGAHCARLVMSFFLLGMVAVGCGPSAAETALPATPGRTPQSSPTPPPTATAFAPAGEPTATGEDGGSAYSQNDLFATAGLCASCHTDMTTGTGMDVSIDPDWRVSVMANAGIDPLWQAAVAHLYAMHPDQEAQIESTCSTCHVPMPAVSAAAEGETVELLGEGGIVDPSTALDPFSAEGVSCTVCHQIRADNLGFQRSYSGGFLIDTELRPPFRLIFGPYLVPDDLASLMQDAAGFRPEQGPHLGQSESCATCHTVYADYLDAFGEVAGTLPQQTTYLEWFYSDYSSFAGCVDCHMEDADSGVRIAVQSQALRSPFERHTFLGGNAFILQVLSVFHADELLAAAESYLAASAEIEAFLEAETANVTLADVRVISRNLYADILVENNAGHKFPTGFPSRRAWLHIIVEDVSGNIIFESGGFRADGSIVGNASDEGTDGFEPHYLAIVQEDQVQIYETILQSTENVITTDLLYAARYLKDNRLLPPGYERDAPYEDLAPRGRAVEDEDFNLGEDVVELIAPLGEAEGPFFLRVELLFQPVSYRWLEDMALSGSDVVQQLTWAFSEVDNTPIIIAVDEANLE